MAEKAGERVQKAIENVINELDRTKLRRMQRDMHLCAAKCCDTQTENVEAVHRCVERCGTNVSKAQQIIQTELNQFQNKLQRCVMQCQDDIRDRMPAKASDADAEKYRGQFESCVVKCADGNIDGIPRMLKKIKELIDEASKS